MSNNTLQRHPKTLLGQTLRFGLIGGLGAAINLLLYLGLIGLHVHYVVASCVGWLTALVLVFGLNRAFTFGSDQPLLKSLAKTFSVYLGQQVVFVAGLITCTEVFRLGPLLSYIINLPIAVLVSFLGLKFFAMARKKT